jgi:hypothetical protein
LITATGKAFLTISSSSHSMPIQHALRAYRAGCTGTVQWITAEL